MSSHQPLSSTASFAAAAYLPCQDSFTLNQGTEVV